VSALARLLSIEKRHGAKSVEQLEQEINELRDEARVFRRANRLYRDRAHAAVDQTIADAKQYAEALLANVANTQGPLHVGLDDAGRVTDIVRAANLLAMSTPEFAATWHAIVDRTDGFSELTSEEYAKRVAAFDEEIGQRQAELERRRIIAAKEEAEAELVELEQRV
jgi:hypothetical protein